MQNDSFLDKLLCGKTITQRETALAANTTLGEQIASLTAQLQEAQREFNSIVASADQSKQEQLAKIVALEKEKTELLRKQAELQQQLAQSLPSDLIANSPNFQRLSSATREIMNAYENKYTKVMITYPARYLGKPENRLDMDVRCFLYPNPNDWHMTSWLSEHNCRIKDVQKDYPNHTFDQLCEIAAVRIQARLDNPYGYDSARWGVNEFWQFADETLVGLVQRSQKADCDDWAILKENLAYVAGIPYELRRLVTGTTFGNEGHATNSMYFPTLGHFYHMNSTSRCKDNDDIYQFKRMGDGSEQLNIETPWWSSTPKYSYMQMTTGAQERNFKLARKSKKRMHRLARLIKVKPYVF